MNKNSMQPKVSKNLQVTACCGGTSYTSVVSETGDRALWFCGNCIQTTELVPTNDLSAIEGLALKVQDARKVECFDLREAGRNEEAEVLDTYYSIQIRRLNDMVRGIVHDRRHGKV